MERCVALDAEDQMPDFQQDSTAVASWKQITVATANVIAVGTVGRELAEQ